MPSIEPKAWIRAGLALIALATCTRLPPASAQGPPNPAVSTPADPDPRQLAEQVRQLAEMNKKLADQLGDLSKKYEDLSKKLGEASPSKPEAPTSTAGRSPETGSSDSLSPRAAGGSSGGGVRNQETAQEVGNRRIGKLKTRTSYDYDRDGFLFATEDSEFQLKVRSLVQADAHVFQQPNQNPVSSGFYLPRARVYFSGRATKPIEYQVSLQRGYDGLELLNAYIDYHYDDRLLFRVGRSKTPYLYEYYKVEIWNTLAPERSLFNINFQGNRQIGAMAWGELFD